MSETQFLTESFHVKTGILKLPSESKFKSTVFNTSTWVPSVRFVTVKDCEKEGFKDPTAIASIPEKINIVRIIQKDTIKDKIFSFFIVHTLLYVYNICT